MRSIRQHFFIFGFYDGGTKGSFLDTGKAQLFQRLFHAVDTNTRIIGNKGRGNAGIDRHTRLNQNFNFFGFIHNLLGVLRADNKALTAKNTFVANNMRLISGKPDRFHRAVSNTFIAVFAV